MTTASGGHSDAGARIRPAVLTHAADLFAERGPAATSLRDIAERSGVNAGLIFRHIGNKEAVVTAVLHHLADDLASARDEDAPAEVIEARAERSWKVIARSLLDGYDVGQLQHRFPVVEQLVAAAREQHEDEYAARVATADALALQLGWRLFGPFIKAATGLDEEPPRTDPPT
ncbi:TetR/AcrR family transcriptional regulator [Mycolicibacterium goodii]|uniref:TetR/AcrR family transcriptional regulator n=1 Tax=Mycolicibacterium goodii TaxID=134601 RepID=A0ABS6HUR5_MYCGD|nr:TetR/AcrR family transcriptional regulator [Mycolicibacterium goodii]OKH73658.1 TetR family transcriptional regulator [Mycobacterium sp. SWH-M5]MBU8810676.1 TetR/AcrR family transcriptional regulator [Mycolicibacterium goodii]MBU8826427.1 TetR/AcrR family transcriptional regulator [Mycolicibacterium goodii]MBU8839607.1 TetR/AcrR family transcriptional regulator [Mycolicibacterium goodii]PJK24253.1 TetR/AcrR family transcriptional regulator [Mycolicibacterium goodii]